MPSITSSKSFWLACILVFPVIAFAFRIGQGWSFLDVTFRLFETRSVRSGDGNMRRVFSTDIFTLVFDRDCSMAVAAGVVESNTALSKVDLRLVSNGKLL